jgi:hypothetical protein
MGPLPGACSVMFGRCCGRVTDIQNPKDGKRALAEGASTEQPPSQDNILEVNAVAKSGNISGSVGNPKIGAQCDNQLMDNEGLVAKTAKHLVVRQLQAERHYGALGI